MCKLGDAQYVAHFEAMAEISFQCIDLYTSEYPEKDHCYGGSYVLLFIIKVVGRVLPNRQIRLNVLPYIK